MKLKPDVLRKKLGMWLNRGFIQEVRVAMVHSSHHHCDDN